MTQEIRKVGKETFGESRGFRFRVKNYGGGIKMFKVKLE